MKKFRIELRSIIAMIAGGLYILLISGIITFWVLVIYALYLLVTGQLYIG